MIAATMAKAQMQMTPWFAKSSEWSESSGDACIADC